MKGFMESAFWIWFAKAQRAVLFVLCIVTTIVVGTACILRYIFHMDLLAYTEYLLFIAFWLYMIGGTQGSYEKSHITADILSIYLKDGLFKDVLEIIKLALTLIFSTVFLVWAMKFAIWSLELGGKTPVLQIPRIIGESSIAVGYTFMTFYNLIFFLDEVINFQKKYSKKNAIEGGVR